MGEHSNISVIIPLYNKVESIGRAIESVLNQSCQAREIIIVDDGSTDNSIEATHFYSDKVEKIKIIQQVNSGVSAARNRGLREASGEWIAFLDADDEWDYDYLNEIFVLMNLFPEATVCATSYYFGDYLGNKKQAFISIPKEKKQFILQNYFSIAAKSAPPLWTSAVCVKKTTLEEIGGFPEGINAGEDLLTWARLAIKNKIAYSINPLAIFWLDKSHTYHAPPNRKFEKEDYVGDELITLLKTSFTDLKGLKKYNSLWHKMRASTFLRYGQFYMVFYEGYKALKFNCLNFHVYFYLLLAFFPKCLRLFFFRKLSSY